MVIDNSKISNKPPEKTLYFGIHKSHRFGENSPWATKDETPMANLAGFILLFTSTGAFTLHSSCGPATRAYLLVWNNPAVWFRGLHGQNWNILENDTL